MMEKEIPLKRRNPKNQGGRPRIEDITDLTTEMEEVAQLFRSGESIPVIAEKLGTTTEKVERTLKNQLVKNRINVLLGDRLYAVAIGRDRLFDAVLESAIRLARQDKLPISEMHDILVRLDMYERAQLLTENEKKLIDGKKQIGGGKIVGSSYPEDNQPKKKSIFVGENQ
jgi:hypothetical protein